MKLNLFVTTKKTKTLCIKNTFGLTKNRVLLLTKERTSIHIMVLPLPCFGVFPDFSPVHGSPKRSCSVQRSLAVNELEYIFVDFSFFTASTPWTHLETRTGSRTACKLHTEGKKRKSISRKQEPFKSLGVSYYSNS